MALNAYESAPIFPARHLHHRRGHFLYAGTFPDLDTSGHANPYSHREPGKQLPYFACKTRTAHEHQWRPGKNSTNKSEAIEKRRRRRRRKSPSTNHRLVAEYDRVAPLTNFHALKRFVYSDSTPGFGTTVGRFFPAFFFKKASRAAIIRIFSRDRPCYPHFLRTRMRPKALVSS